MTEATVGADELPEGTATIDPTDAVSTAEEAENDAFDPAAPAEGDSDLQLGGGTLSEEELAAVTAVLGTLAGAAGAEHNGAGSAGPSDRTLQRRRRLGLWGRPGPDSWKHAAGLR